MRHGNGFVRDITYDLRGREREIYDRLPGCDLGVPREAMAAPLASCSGPRDTGGNATCGIGDPALAAHCRVPVQRSYNYADGNRSFSPSEIEDNGFEPLNWQFQYDLADRLIGASMSPGPGSALAAETWVYGYDRANNRVYDRDRTYEYVPGTNKLLAAHGPDGVENYVHDAASREEEELQRCGFPLATCVCFFWWGQHVDDIFGTPLVYCGRLTICYKGPQASPTPAGAE